MVEGEEEEAYVSQVDHDVEEKLGFLVIISHLLDGILNHQILRDLCPHDFLFFLLSDKSPAPIPCINDILLPDQLPSMEFFFGNKFAPPHSVIPLPCDVFLRATNAFHVNTFRARRNVNNGPIFCCAIIAFTNVAALLCFSIVKIRLFGNVNFIARAVGLTAASRADRTSASNTIFFDFASTASVALNEDIFIILTAIARSPTAS